MKGINWQAPLIRSFNYCNIKTWSVLLLVALTNSCKPLQTEHETNSISFRKSDIRDQYNASLCWAYAVTAWVEWYALNKKNIRLDLSEEALGYFSIAEKLFYRAHNQFGKTATKFNSDIELGDSLPGLMLIAKYGLLPEEFYGKKFRGNDDDLVFRNVERDFPVFLKRLKSPPTMEDIFAFLEDENHLGPRPPKYFRFATNNAKNEEITGLDLLHKIIAFPYSEKNTTLLRGDIHGGIENIVMTLKKSLAQGVPVLLSFNPDWGNIYGSQDNLIFDFQSPNKQESDGGHVVMVEDFVNKGGKIGKISPNELKIETEKPPQELSFILAKNSWGRYSSMDLAKELEDKNFLDLKGASPGQIAITWNFLLANKDSIEITVANEFLNSN